MSSNSGCSLNITVGSVSGPSSVDAGPTHWAAMWATTEMYLCPVTTCCEVSCWPHMEHAVRSSRRAEDLQKT